MFQELLGTAPGRRSSSPARAAQRVEGAEDEARRVVRQARAGGVGGLRGQARPVLRREARSGGARLPDARRARSGRRGGRGHGRRPRARREAALSALTGSRARGDSRALVQRPEAPHLRRRPARGCPGPGPRATAGRPWSRGCPRNTDSPSPELALADVRVPVAVRAERRRGVVHVQGAQPVEPDPRVHVVERRRPAPSASVTSTPDTQRWHESRQSPSRGCPSSAVEERRELVDRAPDRRAGAGRVLHEEPRRVGAVARAPARVAGTARASPTSNPAPRCEPTWKTTPSASIAHGDVHRRHERRDRLLVELVVAARRGSRGRSRGTRTAADAGLRAPLPEAREVLLGMVRRPPRPRALREDLDGVGRRSPRPGRSPCGSRRRSRGGRRAARGYPSDRVRATSPLRAEPDRLPPHRRRPHRALQLALRPPRGRRVPAARREHRPQPRGGGVGRPDPGVARAGSGSTGTATSRSSSTGSSATRRSRGSSWTRATPTRTRARSASACRTRDTTGWDDIVRGRIELPNEKLEDVVLLRSDGRPTYNFASPVDDLDDGITHVVRGEDHVSNTPKQIRILEALGADAARVRAPPERARPGRARSSRSATAPCPWRSSASAGYLPEAIVNYLALLGWSLDAETTVIPPDELVAALHARPRRREPGDLRLPEARVAERRLPARAPARGVRGPARRLPARDRASRATRRRSAPPRRSSRRRSRRSASSRASPASSSRRVEPDPAELDGAGPDPRRGVTTRSRTPSRSTAEPIEEALRGLAERLELKPRQAFAPIRARGHRLEDLAGALRVDRAPRSRGDAAPPGGGDAA